MEQKDEMTQSQSLTPAVLHAVDILDVLATADNPLGLSEVVRNSGIPKASAYRILHTLKNTGLVEQFSEGYMLGSKVMHYHAAYVKKLDIIQVFSRVAEEIVHSIDETVQLARLEGSEVVFLAKQDCKKLIRPAAYPGRRVPAFATAVGKAILSTLPETELKNMYPVQEFPQLTPYTIIQPEAFFAEIAKVRRQGYGATLQESTLNLCCLGAPIRDATGSVVAALSVCMATDKPDALRHQKALEQLFWGAQHISEALGWITPVAQHTEEEA